MVEGRAPDVLESWFLTTSERNNDASLLDQRRADGLAWSDGNHVETLVHGAVYFRRLLEAIRELGKGDQVYFTDWRGDPDQRLADDPETEIGAVLAAAAERGVMVKGLAVAIAHGQARFQRQGEPTPRTGGQRSRG